MQTTKKVGIVACSNAVSITNQAQMNELKDVLNSMNITLIMSNHIYDLGYGFSGTGKERAKALMDFYKEEITDIFDISGGDIGNEILPYLDFDVIAVQDKMFWGYSDLTTIINAIYAKTGKASVLYQVRNLVGADWKEQRIRFENSFCHGKKDLFDISCEFLEANKKPESGSYGHVSSKKIMEPKEMDKIHMSGILVGGNIRCLLKLAGTPYWPDMNGKILFLEARSGKLSQIVTYFSQLKQMGVFEQINGLLLGTFTELECNPDMPQVKDVIRDFVSGELPVAVTGEVGHGMDSKALVIGEYLELTGEQ